MIAYILGSVGAVLGLTATIITIRSTRANRIAQARRDNAEAGMTEDERNTKLRAALDEEYAKRRDVEFALATERQARNTEVSLLNGRLAAQAIRITKLEAQVIALGHVPVNGAAA
jgi:hypothetical protein